MTPTYHLPEPTRVEQHTTKGVLGGEWPAGEVTPADDVEQTLLDGLVATGLAERVDSRGKARRSAPSEPDAAPAADPAEEQ